MNSALRTWTWTIDPKAGSDRAPERADKLILGALSRGAGEWRGEPVSCSRTQIQRLIEEGAVTVEGKTINSKDLLAPGMLVVLNVPPPRDVSVKAQDLPLSIVFEDDHLVVINKPQGLTVHPSVTQMDGTLVNALLHHIKDLSGIGGELRPGIVHRIDKDTSGALVITKSDQAHRRLVEDFSKHNIERSYWALCFGVPTSPEGTIETLIGRNPADRKKMSAKVTHGKKAITHYKVLKQFRDSKRPVFASLIEVTLETGRTHQVRVHLTSMGSSILGDPVYGTPTERQTKWLALPESVRQAVRLLPGQALHARTLGFIHPISKKLLRFEVEAPEAFTRLLAVLESFSTHP